MRSSFKVDLLLNTHLESPRLQITSLIVAEIESNRTERQLSEQRSRHPNLAVIQAEAGDMPLLTAA